MKEMKIMKIPLTPFQIEIMKDKCMRYFLVCCKLLGELEANKLDLGLDL
jgi:hypothetical protein